MKRALWLLPCLLSPLALNAPWTIARSPIGMGWGGYGFFAHWLTKYPNFHGVNRDVLLGMICVIAVAVVPPVFAVTALATRFRHRWLLRIIAAVQVVFYAPVLIELDLRLWILGLWGYWPSSIPDRPALIGPVLHFMSLVSMGIVVFQQRRLLARPLGVSGV